MKHSYNSKLFLALTFIASLVASSSITAQYCASNATSTGDSKIDNVQLIGQTISINQNSAGPCETYTNYTAVPAADIMVGNNYTVNVTLGTCGGNYNKSASVFIDLNFDNDFDDPGENVGNTGFTSVTATLPVNFTLGGCGVPTLGVTRMRVVCQEGGTPAPCGTYSWGETEDYAVNIIANPSPPAANQFYLAGNSIQTSPQCIQLTAASNGQLGMAWDVFSRLNFLTGFSYDFTVNFGNNDGGADGIMFIIQNDPALQCVAPIGGWGAGGISNSLILEMDTYLNFEDRDDGLPGVICAGGPDPDHLDIWINGNIDPTAACGAGPRIVPAAIPTMNGVALYDIENGLDHTLRVSFVPGLPGTFTGSLMNAAATVTYATISYSFDPMTLFGTNTPMYGFSGSTGGLNNQQSFCIPTILLNNKITQFDAKLNEQTTVDITWAAISQTNSDYFVIEKSTDKMSFHELTSTSTNGAIQEVNYYSTIDQTPVIGINYYRLKQVAMDGSFSYSNVKAVERKALNDNMINIYPNPIDKEVTIELLVAGHIDVELHNQLGQLISAPMNQAGNKITLDMSELAAGVYVLQVETDSSSKKAFKIIKEN